PAGTHPYAVQTADFDHDGHLDLAVSNQDSYDVGILMGRGDGTFSADSLGYAVGQYPYSLVIADLNADGILDIAVANGGSGTISILIGHGAAGVGDGSFAPAVSYLAGAQPRFVAAGDMDGDGILDLAVADYAGSVNVLRGGGGAGGG